MTGRAGGTDALAPVRAELLRAARADAEQALAEAHRDAEHALAAARAEAAAVLDRAVRAGTEEGRKAAAEAVGRATRAARARELAAQGEAYAELCHRVAERVRERYESEPGAAESLARRARDLLGPDARITAHPDGGLLATAPGRLVDLGLPALVRHGLDRLGPEAGTLWQPDDGEGRRGG
ncbi:MULTISPECIES: hypothetical protein [Kitasatospora]|uniref:Uncharacterized protein n=1 Tax=Kitasatospora cathayae TaxID=3004092 RepID=A0ABY7PXE5_9ACTN|nr:hypothetical protein [Kitasatospora sp. HUAS 3-15]WBP84636.1 hypothetical protein O1G21_01400 [Kitasatospora sp. HUAS 3-15]